MNGDGNINSEPWCKWCDAADSDQCVCMDDDEYEGCGQCGDGDPDSWESACIDDLCHGGQVPCLHGSYARLKCGVCGK